MHVYELLYMAGRVGPAGQSLFAATEERTVSRGVFGSTLAKNGVAIRLVDWKRQNKIGRGERRSAMLQQMMSKVIKDTHASGRESMNMILSECLNAANEMFCSSTMGTLTSST